MDLDIKTAKEISHLHDAISRLQQQQIQPETLKHLVSSNEYAKRLKEAQQSLEAQWAKLLIEARDTNSQAQSSSRQRRKQEYNLFAEALTLLEPARTLYLAQDKLHELQRQFGDTSEHSTTHPKASPSAEAVHDGLEKLGDSDLAGALRLLALADDSTSVAQMVTKERTVLAREALCDYRQLGNVDNTRQAAQNNARDALRRKVKNLGNERQRIAVDKTGSTSIFERLPWRDTSCGGSVSPTMLPVIVVLALVGVIAVGATVLIKERLPGVPVADGTETPAVVVGSTSTITPTVISTSTITPTVISISSPTSTSTATSVATVSPIPETPESNEVVVRSVEPTEAWAATLPVTLTLQGDNLDEIRAVSLVDPDDQTVPLTIELVEQIGSMNVVIDDLAESLQRETVYTLDISSSISLAETTPLTITLRDYLETKPVEGIRTEYVTATDRIAEDENGLFTRLRTTSNVAAERGAILRSGDRVDILSNDTADWYEIRILESSEAASQGERGWIERWLVDNVGLPSGLVPLQVSETTVPITDTTSGDE